VRVQGLQKHKHAVILFTQHPLYLSGLFFSIIERSVVVALGFYYKDMLEKATMQRAQQFSAFSCIRKSPLFKCSACAVARKIKTDCFCRTLLISKDPAVRISRNLAKNSSQTT